MLADLERYGDRQNLGFVRAMLDNPLDHNIKLVYADWLEENGEADLAALIRLTCSDVKLLDDKQNNNVRDLTNLILQLWNAVYGAEEYQGFNITYFVNGSEQLLRRLVTSDCIRLHKGLIDILPVYKQTSLQKILLISKYHPVRHYRLQADVFPFREGQCINSDRHYICERLLGTNLRPFFELIDWSYYSGNVFNPTSVEHFNELFSIYINRRNGLYDNTEVTW